MSSVLAGRAAPMNRDDRRAAIIAATLPLLHVHGHAVTTRQIAEASGIGEGTIFRVFADKTELVNACLLTASDPSPTLRRLAEIDRDQPLQLRLLAAVEILQDRLTMVIGLLIALRFPGAPEDGHQKPHPRPPDGHHVIENAIADLLSGDTEVLRLSPARTASAARLLTFAASHPKITDGQPMTPTEIVDLLLFGVSKESPC